MVSDLDAGGRIDPEVVSKKSKVFDAISSQGACIRATQEVSHQLAVTDLKTAIMCKKMRLSLAASL
jgi:hypothetical protein